MCFLEFSFSVSNSKSTRLEIISDVVSEKARSEKIPIPHQKYRYHIGNTDTTSEIICNREDQKGEN
jgi:hypothetical protein